MAGSHPASEASETAELGQLSSLQEVLQVASTQWEAADGGLTLQAPVLRQM